jgi:hypothetical protein
MAAGVREAVGAGCVAVGNGERVAGVRELPAMTVGSREGVFVASRWVGLPVGLHPASKMTRIKIAKHGLFMFFFRPAPYPRV